MKRVLSILDACAGYLTTQRRNEQSAMFYTKALIVFAIVRALTLWSVADVFFYNYTAPTPSGFIGSIALWPARLVAENPGNVLWAIAAALCILLLVRPNFITNVILFWIVLNLFVMKYPVTNGSDYLLFIMALWNTPLSHHRFENAAVEIVNVSAFNLFVVLSKLQVVAVYLISAWDKIMNATWRSGDAIVYVTNLDTVFNPILGRVEQGGLAFALAWITIAFEVAFVIFVWKKRTRLWVLCVGVLFHLMIWIFLSLPDFSLLMILCYLVFLTDDDWKSFRRRITRQPL